MSFTKLDIEIFVEDTPLLQRRCDCGSDEFRQIVIPDNSFRYLSPDFICIECNHHYKRPEDYSSGLAICLKCHKIVALM